MREVERLQHARKRNREEFVGRPSSTDPQAHVMRNGEGGTVPSYNVLLVTDTTHGLVVNVEATIDAIDYRQLEPALDRCKTTVSCLPKQIVADGDYTNHASVKAAAAAGVRFLWFLARELEASGKGCTGSQSGLYGAALLFMTPSGTSNSAK